MFRAYLGPSSGGTTVCVQKLVLILFSWLSVVLVWYVSGVSTAHHQEVQPYIYKNWYLLFFLDDCLLSWLDMFRAYLSPSSSGTTVSVQKLVLIILFRWLLSWMDWIPSKKNFNLLKPTGYVMHHQFNIQQLYVLPTLYLCVLYLSENKQRLVPLTE